MRLDRNIDLRSDGHQGPRRSPRGVTEVEAYPADAIDCRRNDLRWRPGEIEIAGLLYLIYVLAIWIRARPIGPRVGGVLRHRHFKGLLQRLVVSERGALDRSRSYVELPTHVEPYRNLLHAGVGAIGKGRVDRKLLARYSEAETGGRRDDRIERNP